MSQEKGNENFVIFKNWVKEHKIAGDWSNYVRGSKLNRAEIAMECGFSRNVFKSGQLGNPKIVKLLSITENELLQLGILIQKETTSSDALSQAEKKRAILKEAKLQKLEVENQLLKAKIERLEYQLNHMHSKGILIR